MRVYMYKYMDQKGLAIIFIHKRSSGAESEANQI